MNESTTITKAEAITAGAKYFQTGKPCKRGHLAPRFVSCNGCVECSREKSKNWYGDKGRGAAKMRKWRAANKDQDKATRKVWRKKNPDKIKIYAINFDKKFPDARKEICKRWYWKNPQVQRERCRENRNKNIESRREYSKAYNSANKPKLAAIARNRRARQRAGGGTHTETDVNEIFKAQRGKCGYCRMKLGKSYHVDHIIALANGGSNDRRNLQILCVACNKSKSAKDPIDFAQSKGMLL